MKYLRIFSMLMLSASLALGLVACGGGGGSSNGAMDQTPASLSEADAGVATSAVNQTSSLFDPIVSTGVSTGDLAVQSEVKKAPLNALIDEMIALSRILPGSVAAQGGATEILFCPDGGTLYVDASWSGPDIPSDPSEIVDLDMTITTDNCGEFPYTMDGTITMTFSGPLNQFTGFTFSTSLGFSFEDSTYPFDLTMAGSSMSLTGITWSGEVITSGTLTLNGALSGTLDSEVIDEEYDNFQIVYSESAGTFQISLSGSLKASCLDGWVTVSTPVAISGSLGADCPADGEIVITSGNNEVTVVINSDNSIDVYFNDTFIQMYNDCYGLTGVCAA